MASRVCRHAVFSFVLLQQPNRAPAFCFDFDLGFILSSILEVFG